MKKILLFTTALLLLTACQESLEEKAAREAREVTESKCPMPIGDNMYLDSIVFDIPTLTQTQYFRFTGNSDNDSTVENIVSDFEYARGWHTTPHCIWLYTTLLTPEKLCKTRFDSRGMRTVQNDFKEYGTMDATGKNITPASNVVTFTLENEKNIVETILTADEARRYTIKNVFTEWNPVKTLKQVEKKARQLWRRQ